jgi:hypothetical protein
MERLEFYAPGSKVCFPAAGIGDAVVVSFEVTVGGATYEVAWWAGGTRHTARLQGFELAPPRYHDPRALSIGFAAGGG